MFTRIVSVYVLMSVVYKTPPKIDFYDGILMENNNYILFIIQDANFQSRSMLVPEKEFLEIRKEDFETLKKYSKTVTLSDGSNEYQIDNLLVQNFTRKGNFGKPENHEYSYFYFCLQGYADGLDEGCYYGKKDHEWYDKAIINFCEGFNHIKNYCQAKTFKTIDNKPINIVESFLLLESENGKIKQPMFDTVKEMMLGLYSKK